MLKPRIRPLGSFTFKKGTSRIMVLLEDVLGVLNLLGVQVDSLTLRFVGIV